jgi:hypothetical protein
MTIVTMIHNALARVGHGIFDFYDSVQEAWRQAQTFEALAALSDAELARRGLKREELAHAVLGIRKS